MFSKLKQLFKRERLFTRAEVIKVAEDYGEIRYNAGKNDGIAIAQEKAKQVMKEIVWQKQTTKK